MPKVILSMTVELTGTDKAEAIQAILNNYYFTSDGIKYLDGEFKKPVSMAKTASSRFLKKK